MEFEEDEDEKEEDQEPIPEEVPTSSHAPRVAPPPDWRALEAQITALCDKHISSMVEPRQFITNLHEEYRCCIEEIHKEHCESVASLEEIFSPLYSTILKLVPIVFLLVIVVFLFPWFTLIVFLM